NAERALGDTNAEIERLRREIETMEEAIPAFLGIDPRSIASAVENGLAAADPDRISENLEQTVRAALVRGWITAESQIEQMDLFGGMVMGLVEQCLETGRIIEEDLAPVRDVIGQIEARADAFNEVLEKLGLTTAETERAMRGLARNLPIGGRALSALRFQA